MAKITNKSTRRYRMQFTMSRESFELYQALLCRASELGLVVDFATDFESWFAGQLDQVRHELQTHENTSVEVRGDNDTE